MKYKHRDVEFTKEFIESLPKTIDPMTGCWLYDGYILRGYGILCSNYEDYPVHRLSVAVYHNKNYFDPSWESCHKLECLNKNCFNPTHLYAGTHADNMKDHGNSGTHWNTKKDNCPKCGHPYRSYTTKTGDRKGQTQRVCRNCQNIRRRKRG